MNNTVVKAIILKTYPMKGDYIASIKFPEGTIPVGGMTFSFEEKIYKIRGVVRSSSLILMDNMNKNIYDCYIKQEDN